MLVVFWGVSFAPFCVFNPAAGDFGGGGGIAKSFADIFVLFF